MVLVRINVKATVMTIALKQLIMVQYDALIVKVADAMFGPFNARQSLWTRQRHPFTPMDKIQWRSSQVQLRTINVQNY